MADSICGYRPTDEVKRVFVCFGRIAVLRAGVKCDIEIVGRVSIVRCVGIRRRVPRDGMSPADEKPRDGCDTMPRPLLHTRSENR